MSKPSIECQYFEHVPEHSVAACRECRYAVWPDQIEGHLQKQHKVSYKEAEAVGQQVRSWAGLVQYPSELERLFSSRHGSQYFEVQAPSQDGEGPEIVPVDGSSMGARASRWPRRADIEKRAQTTIQEGERDEVNPWLERTQWLPYLVGMERPDLLAQASIIDRIGVFIRLEAIRTEMHQTRFQPLQPYMDKNAIVKHTRPWQQMLMFFARTQKEHGWSPKYRFTRRQREAWEVLIEQAKRSIEGDEEDEAEDMDEEREELDEEMMDDIDEAIEVAEEEPGQEKARA
ncbi:DUF3505 domain containing protein [Pyrenophora tritici-repentis]|nr:DUF3505 domain containing protein [Pyrenophora tritici-repentis]